MPCIIQSRILEESLSEELSFRKRHDSCRAISGKVTKRKSKIGGGIFGQITDIFGKTIIVKIFIFSNNGRVFG